jgi:FlaA1/EpsC-like NDP-sugar epimerase
MDVEQILGRPKQSRDLTPVLLALAREKILVTGAAGSIGLPVVRELSAAGCDVTATDVDDLDVRDADKVSLACDQLRPTLVVHLAGEKYAPEGEINPLNVLEVNGVGTVNVVRAAARIHARVVLASTCKACNPETTYGASKLIAERMVLNAGGWVARFYNVVETQGNVFEIWSRIPADEPLPVTPCRRFFLSVDEVTGLVLTTPTLPPGRYTMNPGEPRWMAEVAQAIYPDRPTLEIPARKGDRLVEPRHADQETLVPVSGGIERVVSTHDGGDDESRA